MRALVLLAALLAGCTCAAAHVRTDAGPDAGSCFIDDVTNLWVCPDAAGAR